jgi:hypothetical protein
MLSAIEAIVIFTTLTGPTGVPRGRKPRAGWAGGPLRQALIGRVLEIKARASHQLESRLSESPES